MNTTVAINQTVNTTDIRFNLGKILTNLEKRRSPILNNHVTNVKLKLCLIKNLREIDLMPHIKT